MTRQWDGNVHTVVDLDEGREYMSQDDLNALLHNASILSSVMGATVTPIMRPTQIYTACELSWFRSPVGAL